jgi:hypothetical protein
MSPATGEVQWLTPRGAMGSVDGLAVLRGHGVLVVSEFSVGLHALSQEDGSALSPPLRLPAASFLAVDRASNTIYASTEGAVVGVVWTGSTLQLTRSITSLGKQASRPIAVVPAVSAAGGSRLVVGNYSASRLDVLSLPRLRPVAAYRLPRGTKVVGLAADASGTALLIMDARTKNGDVFPWTLPTEWMVAAAPPDPLDHEDSSLAEEIRVAEVSPQSNAVAEGVVSERE